jgi:hypothetical protein
VDGSDNTDDRPTGQPIDDIDRADRAGTNAIISLLSHPRTAAIITAHADALRALVPHGFARDQVAMTDLGMAASIWPATGLAWLRPEGVPAAGPVKPLSDWPVLVDKKNSHLTSRPWAAGWPGLPEDERAKLHAYVGEVRAALVALANDLADAERARAAGLGDVHPHQLRHSAAHDNLAEGMSEGNVMMLMGWRSPAMLRPYGAAQAANRAEAAFRQLGGHGDRL